MIAVTDRFLRKGLLGPMVDPSDDSYHGISDSRSLGFLVGLSLSLSESDSFDSLWVLE